MVSAQRTELQQVAHKQASQSILKALDLIDALVNASAPLSLNELSKLVERPVPTVHRLLRTLALRGWVEGVGGRYRLTLRLFEIGMAVVERIDIVAEARPECEALSRELEETVHMGVRSGASVVYVLKIDTPRSMRLISQLGLHLPLYCTALGKAMLAAMDPSDRATLIDQMTLEPRARNTITDRETLLQELVTIAGRGWSVDNEELDVGLVCVGAPVFDRTGGLAGAISVSGPKARLPEARWEAIGGRVRSTADGVSRRLGYRPTSAAQAAAG